jgi:hypothetical protein
MGKIFRLYLSIIWLLCCISFIPAESSAGFGKWQLRNPSSPSIFIQSLAYGKGTYVASTIEGIVYSDDLITWRKAEVRTRYLIHMIRYHNGVFYAISNNGPSYSSANGVTWTKESFPGTPRLLDVAFGKSMLVAVGKEDIFVAEQGEPWTRVEVRHAGDLVGVAFGNGVFTVVGKRGIIFVSRNGRDWTEVDLGMKGDFTAIAFGNGRFVAATEQDTVKGSVTNIGPRKCITSRDGYSWTEPHVITGRIGSIIWKKGRFWSVPFQGVSSSSDGVTWRTTSGTSDSRISNVYDGGDYLVAVGNGILVSTDGDRWSPVVSGTTKGLNDITYAKGLFIAVGSQGAIVTSPDGRKWTERYVTSKGFSGGFSSILEMKGKLVAISPNYLYSSDNGLDWRQEYMPKGVAPFAAAKGAEAIVAVGAGGKILRSTDLKHWSVIESGINELIAEITYGAGIFTAITNNGSILTSRDQGKTWQVTSFNEDLRLLHVSFGNHMFLLYTMERGIYGDVYLYSSADGVGWQRVPMEVPLPSSTSRLSFLQGEFIATTSGSKILTSADGRVWTVSDTGALGSINAVAYGNTSYVVVGAYGRIMQSDARH